MRTQTHLKCDGIFLWALKAADSRCARVLTLDDPNCDRRQCVQYMDALRLHCFSGVL